MTSLIQSLPKAELHIHIEGALEPDLSWWGSWASRWGAFSCPYDGSGGRAASNDALRIMQLQGMDKLRQIIHAWRTDLMSPFLQQTSW